jgi:hypothetical protein
MNAPVNHANLHRTAKYFMDNGRVASHAEAIDLLETFGLTIYVGPEVGRSSAHQTALLTLINVARRTLLGGVEVIGLSPGHFNLTRLSLAASLGDAVAEFGGTAASLGRLEFPAALIGTVEAAAGHAASWHVTWQGWRGGVVPYGWGERLAEDCAMALAPAMAAAACAAEVFSLYAGDHPLAGRRYHGLSLWDPRTDWLAGEDGPVLSYLPSKLWLIGLGNLGQAYVWSLAMLPYADRSKVTLVLQDFDRMAESNESTSLLASSGDVGKRKVRVIGEWLDARDFETVLEERRFGRWTRRTADEPGAALCGVDNSEARAALEEAGFGLVIEAGLGAGESFRSLALHAFPASRSAASLWSKQRAGGEEKVDHRPAYKALRNAGMDECGLAQLASRTVGVPFVGLIAGCLVISELLRRLNGGLAFEFLAGSASTLADLEGGNLDAPVYAHGHVLADSGT